MEWRLGRSFQGVTVDLTWNEAQLQVCSHSPRTWCSPPQPQMCVLGGEGGGEMYFCSFQQIWSYHLPDIKPPSVPSTLITSKHSSDAVYKTLHQLRHPILSVIISTSSHFPPPTLLSGKPEIMLFTYSWHVPLHHTLETEFPKERRKSA